MSDGGIIPLIIATLNRSGLAVVTRMQAGRVKVAHGWMHLGDEGWPDIVGHRVSDGRAIAIEAKAAKGRTREAQVAWLAKASRHGVLCGIARSVQDAIDIVCDTNHRGT